MTKIINLKLFGIDLQVEVCYEEKSVSNVENVFVNGSALPCNTAEFYDQTKEMLDEALEQALLEDKLAHEDYLYEVAREEGRINYGKKHE